MMESLTDLVQMPVWQYAVSIVIAFVGGWAARGGGRPPSG